MMVKIATLLLFAVLICGQSTCAQSCVIDSLIDLKIKEAVDAKVAAALSKTKLICTGVSARGADVSCPSGYLAVSCSCGMACGSWDIRGETACHCQCHNIDWTSGRCCKMALA